MLDLIGISLYLGTDRLLRPRGGAGVFRKVWCYKTLPPPQKKKKLHMEIVPPLVITIFKTLGSRKCHLLRFLPDSLSK